MKWVMKARMGLFVACLAAFVAGAQDNAAANGPGVVLPQGVYADADVAAHAAVAQPGQRAQLRQAIDEALKRNPKDVAALVQRAYFFAQGGDPEHSRQDFDAAIAAATTGSVAERNVLWSRGWADYDRGDYAGTLADWQRAVALHGGHPFWAPYSFALLYWTIGKQDAALAWYDAAVASNAEWGTDAGVAKRTAHWSDPQQDRMRALFTAWSARKPVAAKTNPLANAIPDPTPVPDGVVPPDGNVDGASIGEWTGRWWRWALSQPVAPFLDPDGRLCEEGQSGPVWYLAGTSGDFDAQRECVVPTGKYLLAPIINMIHMDADSQHPRRCAEMQAEAAVNNDHLVSVVVLIDGVQLQDAARFRVRSDGCFVLTHDDQGPRYAAADGYWLMLKPLKPGRHTLTIGANYGADNKKDCYCNMVQNFEYVLYVGGKSVLSRADIPSSWRMVARRFGSSTPVPTLRRM